MNSPSPDYKETQQVDLIPLFKKIGLLRDLYNSLDDSDPQRNDRVLSALSVAVIFFQHMFPTHANALLTEHTRLTLAEIGLLVNEGWECVVKPTPPAPLVLPALAPN